ncbi:MAG: cytochrome c biogenesis protein CcsA [Candidatus Zixiibacteriota bacterium]
MEILGKTLIWSAAVTTLFSLVLYVRGEQHTRMARNVFRVTAGLLTASLGLLLFLILTHRFEFVYVRNYSSTDLPLYYLIATLWGGQEGTLLLWIFYVSLLGMVFMKMARGFERWSMATVSLFILSILVILLKRSPFEATATGPAEGAGLNPLLQDFWMTIHPPVMFLGFALSVFPFAIAVAGWVRREYRAWTPLAWVWLLAAWCTLGTALVMGGYWAYKVLGWGGYWAWDPVENSSLIPWIFATGGVHALIMLKKKNALTRSAYMFSILPFIAVLYGSFLTRSGILGDFSVHSFLDLGINQYLVAGLVLFTVIGFGVMIWRGRHVRGTVAYSSMKTVDFLISMGVLSLLVAGALVLIGMSTPLWTRLFGPASNVSLNYYFMATTPIALILLFGLSFFPFMRWIKASKPVISVEASICFALAIFATGGALMAGMSEVLYLVLIFLAMFATASNTWLLFEHYARTKGISGAYLAHVGLAVLIIGAAVSSAYETKAQVGLPLGQPVEKMGWILTYQGKDMNAPEGKTPYHILVERPGSSTAYICSPRQFQLPYDGGVMRKPAVKKFLTMDLYISPLDEVGGSGKQGVTATLARDQAQSVGGFNLTFLGFNVDGHGEGANVDQVDCEIEIMGDMYVDTLVPAFKLTAQGVSGQAVQFADGRYSLGVDRIDATTGAVQVTLVDHQNPLADTPVFWIELAEKPLINLFWFGTTLMVLGGLLAVRKRVRRWRDEARLEPGLPDTESRVRLAAGSNSGDHQTVAARGGVTTD